MSKEKEELKGEKKAKLVKKKAAKKTTKKTAKKVTKKAAKKTVTAKKTQVTKKTVSQQEIQTEAYLNYLGRLENGTPGDSQSDWDLAVKTLNA